MSKVEKAEVTLADFEKAAIVGALLRGAVGVGKMVAKRPMKTLGAAFVGGEAVSAGRQASKAHKARVQAAKLRH